MTDNWRALTPGQHLTADWTAQPEPPGIEQQGADVAQSCPACRSGDTLSVSFFPFVDPAGNRTRADPGVTTELSLYLDGTLLDRQPAPSGQFLLSPTPATYQLALDVSRDAAWWPSSTRSHTVWTFASSERAPDPLPAGWTGGGKGGGGSRVAQRKPIERGRLASRGLRWNALLARASAPAHQCRTRLRVTTTSLSRSSRRMRSTTVVPSAPRITPMEPS